MSHSISPASVVVATLTFGLLGACADPVSHATGGNGGSGTGATGGATASTRGGTGGRHGGGGSTGTGGRHGGTSSSGSTTSGSGSTSGTTTSGSTGSSGNTTSSSGGSTSSGSTSSGTTTSGSGSTSGTTTSGSTSSGGSTSSTSSGGSTSPPSSAASNPVTTPLTSAQCSGKIYAVGTDADVDALPWSTLGPGDCVNIAHGAAPYTHKFCLAAVGTSTAPVVIHGVTDAAGDRPVFDFGASTTTTAPDCAKVFDSASAYNLETEGGIVVTAPQFPSSDPTYNGTKPTFIQIENLELHGATQSAKYQSLTGVMTTYDGLASGVYVQLAADLTVANCVIYDCNYAVFTQAKDDTLQGATERFTLRDSRVYGNGVAGNYLTHNLYIQSTNPVIEGNYIGQTRPGSLGSSYKSRSSGEIFRYNYVVASARALDLVHSENDIQGVLLQPDYGLDYVYGNIIVNDSSTPNGAASVPIHYGGDNLGEDNSASQTTTVEGTCSTCVPPGTYRSHLFFFDNLFWSDAPQGLVNIFEPSLQSTSVYTWNNLYSLNGAAYYAWLQHAGTVYLLGNNLANVVSGGKVYNSENDAYLALWGAAQGTDTLFAVKLDAAGKLLSAAPGFVGPTTYDFLLGAASPAIGQATGVPGSLPSSTPGYALLASLPVDQEPLMAQNGLAPRATAKDLGPEEH